MLLRPANRGSRVGTQRRRSFLVVARRVHPAKRRRSLLRTKQSGGSRRTPPPGNRVLRSNGAQGNRSHAFYRCRSQRSGRRARLAESRQSFRSVRGRGRIYAIYSVGRGRIASLAKKTTLRRGLALTRSKRSDLLRDGDPRRALNDVESSLEELARLGQGRAGVAGDTAGTHHDPDETRRDPVAFGALARSSPRNGGAYSVLQRKSRRGPVIRRARNWSPSPRCGTSKSVDLACPTA
jgi:hypothetical protein